MSEMKIPKSLLTLQRRLEWALKNGKTTEEKDIRADIGSWIMNQRDQRLRELAEGILEANPPARVHQAKTTRSNGPRPRLGGQGYDRDGSQDCVEPNVFGLQFHNPYTFIPFTETPLDKREPSLLTVDELPDEQRFTGILTLEITTQSPLLTCDPDPVGKNRTGSAAQDRTQKQSKHETYRALTIGSDVVVPASGVRGSLRNLMTILTGGTLTNLDPHAYATQGRDLSLGPATPQSPDLPQRVFLGRVEEAGTTFHDGRIQLGETELIPVGTIAAAVAAMTNSEFDPVYPQNWNERRRWTDNCNRLLQRYRPGRKKPQTLYLRHNGDGWVASHQQAEGDWEVKFSGRPINLKGKREGIFRLNGKTVTVSRDLWKIYRSRHLHSDHQELRRGDLVWLEPHDYSLNKLQTAVEIKSLQWSRWGRRGQAIRDLIEEHQPDLLPDNPQAAGMVDLVTDLFGKVSMDEEHAISFAGRVVPENLVFLNSSTTVFRQALSPLGGPHPGCAAFYRWQGDPGQTDPDNTCGTDPFRGYKVYRTSQETDVDGPWNWDQQGVWEENIAELKPERQSMNKTVDLLPTAARGQLRIAFRAVDREELALLLYTCSMPWRLGGGKPFGLGLCSVSLSSLVDELGQPLDSAEFAEDLLPEPVRVRANWWHASQEPVAKLRYPRAVNQTRFRGQRGGHAWFGRHANPRKSSQADEDARGLEIFRARGALSKKFEGSCVKGQVLPPFDPKNPQGDLLSGYDGIALDPDQHRDSTTWWGGYREFDPSLDVRSEDKSSGRHTPNAEDRRRDRKER
ncbi:MAG: hypothetical protein ABIF77_04240 [bacterium]